MNDVLKQAWLGGKVGLEEYELARVDSDALEGEQ